MKKILISAFAVLLTTAGFANTKYQLSVELKSVDTLAVDWNDTSMPMPMSVIYEYDDDYNEIGQTLRHIYYNEEDSALYAPVASTYKLLVDGSKQTTISFAGEQPNANEWGSIIGGKYAYCMKGLNYNYTGEALQGFAFNGAFLQNHEIIALKYPENTVPKYLIDSLQVRYDNEVKSSYTCATSMDEKFSIYSVQMKPKYGKCLGMRVVSVDNSLYIFEEWCQEYNEESAWHVDDGGEYYQFAPIAVTKGEKGYDIFYYDGAPESSTYAAMLLRNGKLKDYTFVSYFNYIDYNPN